MASEETILKHDLERLDFLAQDRDKLFTDVAEQFSWASYFLTSLSNFERLPLRSTFSLLTHRSTHPQKALQLMCHLRIIVILCRLDSLVHVIASSPYEILATVSLDIFQISSCKHILQSSFGQEFETVDQEPRPVTW